MQAPEEDEAAVAMRDEEKGKDEAEEKGTQKEEACEIGY